MKPVVLFALLAASFPASPAFADWKPVEKVENYAISGQTGPDLYASIGEAGPLLGKGRVIAHTNFKLTWTRDYKPQGGACVLKSARPKLIITYTLPKPAAPLSPSVQKSWGIFAAGLAAHEKVHGAAIVEMVRKIEAISVGMTVADDPGCTKIRIELTRQLAEISLAQRQASRDFDKVEFGPGGNLRQLVFNLMTGK
jgi:predicted secreted Zn-dependent protease